MSIYLGNNNKINNSIISENSSPKITSQKHDFTQKHPFISGIIIAIIAGFILSFSFWEQIKIYIERLVQ